MFVHLYKYTDSTVPTQCSNHCATKQSMLTSLLYKLYARWMINSVRAAHPTHHGVPLSTLHPNATLFPACEGLTTSTIDRSHFSVRGGGGFGRRPWLLAFVLATCASGRLGNWLWTPRDSVTHSTTSFAPASSPFSPCSFVFQLSQHPRRTGTVSATFMVTTVLRTKV